MNAEPPAEPADHGLTVESLRTRHGELLDLSTEATGDALHGPVRAFVNEVVAKGVYFDEGAERRALQGYVDHWVRELLTGSSSDEKRTLQRVEIGAYDERALRALQADFANPFGSLCTEWTTITEDKRTSPTEVMVLLESTARAAGLRFQDGLLKEISAQLAADPQAATLAEFCLWHLFEDPSTRIGNKLRRPEGELAFGCLGYLVDKAERLLTAQPGPRERDLVLETLSLFDPSTRPAGSTARVPHLALPRGSPASFALYGQEGLDLQSFLLQSRLVFAQGDDLVLVHDVLPARWMALALVIADRRTTSRVLRRLAAGALVAVVAGAGVYVGKREYDAYEMGLAMARSGESWNAAGTARAEFRHYYPAYQSASQYLSEDDFRKMMFAALWTSAPHHDLQIRRALEALDAADSPYLRNVANDALGATVGYLARVGALGAMPFHPTLMERCGGNPWSGVCVGVGSRSVVLGTAQDVHLGDVELATDAAGGRFAVAWRERDVVRLQIHALAAGPGDAAGGASGRTSPLLDKTYRNAAGAPIPAGSVRCDDLPEGRQRPGLRFSADGRLIVMACSNESDTGVGYEVSWVHEAVGGDPATPPLASILGRFKQMSDAATAADKVSHRSPVQRDPALEAPCTLVIGANRHGARAVPDANRAYMDGVFVGTTSPLSEAALVTTNQEGYVRLWHAQSLADALPRPGGTARETTLPCASALFPSDFVRLGVAGIPKALAFHEASDVIRYAIHQEYPPVIRIFEQRDPQHADQIMESYLPPGLTSVSAMRFRGKRCLAIDAVRPVPLSLPGPDALPVPNIRVTYHLLFDKPAIETVGTRLRAVLDQYRLTATRASTETQRFAESLSEYEAALRSVCDGS